MPTPRRKGVIVSFRLSKSGGLGRILSDNEVFFFCRNFIREGLPVCGCPVSFEVRAAREGTEHRQAVEIIVNNRSIIRRMELSPRIFKAATPDPNSGDAETQQA